MAKQDLEARLIAQGCTRELWRTIKPDLILYADDNGARGALALERLSRAEDGRIAYRMKRLKQVRRRRARRPRQRSGRSG
jgi:hypothetical protein